MGPVAAKAPRSEIDCFMSKTLSRCFRAEDHTDACATPCLALSASPAAS
jgi:hypothetical protein